MDMIAQGCDSFRIRPGAGQDGEEFGARGAEAIGQVAGGRGGVVVGVDGLAAR